MENYQKENAIKDYGKEITNGSNEKEGKLAKAIEKQTAKLPSDFFLWPALGAMGASLILKLAKKNQTALFVGQWAAPIMLFGIYDKIVKTQGSERDDK